MGARQPFLHSLRDSVTFIEMKRISGLMSWSGAAVLVAIVAVVGAKVVGSLTDF